MGDPFVGKTVDVADAAALALGREVREPCEEAVAVEQKKRPPDGTFVAPGRGAPAQEFGGVPRAQAKKFSGDFEDPLLGRVAARDLGVFGR